MMIRGLHRLFGDLKVRPKLMVLHNLFFLILTGSVYFTLIPMYERQLRALGVSPGAFAESIQRAQLVLFLVLGVIYVLAVLALELLIMPLYVYRPLRLMLDADESTRTGDRVHELIPEDQILGDEIGQIMRSRNTTVAELRRREDDLQRKNEMLEMQDRLASLGLMSASVAHELNTPLAVLQGSIEKLSETATDAHMLERLGRMRRVTERLRKISEGLLEFARPGQGQKEPIAVRPLVEEAWSLVAIDDRAAEVAFVNLVDEEVRMMGDADRLIQVFVNLLRNALNAVHERGRIEVHGHKVRVGARMFAAVRVEDNGPGIPSDILPDIFDAFVTTRLDSKGTGLGLTVTEGIVHQHGGTIAASNRAGGGACLEVRIPAAE
jgi:signal transduction histidine kinase